ncbi:MAG: right-handed parallel beta-helix repeat-containing protein [Kiritimatiellae bacterium]|nr:right-handed parallel beta-helix repeat-containing protein [Kiritimatiellia bacterium]
MDEREFREKLENCLEQTASLREQREVVAAAAGSPALRVLLTASLSADASLKALRSERAPFVRSALEILRNPDAADRFAKSMRKKVEATVVLPAVAARRRARRRAVILRGGWLWKAAAACVLVGLGAAVLYRTRIAGRVARVAAVEGQVALRRDATDAVCRPGTWLRAGDELLAGADGGFAIAFVGERTRVDVSGNSVLAFAGIRAGKRLELRHGVLDASVVKQPAGRPLRIVTPHAEASVLGTRLRVMAGAGSTRLEVREGEVELTAREGHESVVVAAGQVAEVAPETPLVARTPGRDYYVDAESRGGPSDDAGPGSKSRPWRTLARAFAEREPRPSPGDTIWVRGGVYGEALTITRGGAPGAPLALKAYPGEQPMLDGQGKLQRGIQLPREAAVEELVIEGLALRNFTARAWALYAGGARRLVLRALHVADAAVGVWFDGCRESSMVGCDIHDCDTNVGVFNSSSNVLLRGNHLHHARVRENVSISTPAAGVVGRGALSTVVPHAPGIARFTCTDLQLDRIEPYGRELRGRAEGETRTWELVLLFADPAEPRPDAEPIPGGILTLPDGRGWFPLRNNPDWDNRPYSPDGKSGLFEIGRAQMDRLAAARYVYVAVLGKPELGCREIRIVDNEIDHAARFGLTAHTVEGLFVAGNNLHHNRTTAVSVGHGSRRVWIEANRCRANNAVHWYEAGIEVAASTDVVIQNNTTHENRQGIRVSQCERVLVRRNIVYQNRAQGRPENDPLLPANSGGLAFNGGTYDSISAPPGARDNAFVHNTLYGNGHPRCRWSEVRYGHPKCLAMEGNSFLNNAVQSATDAVVFEAWGMPRGRLDGNIYFGTRMLVARWYGTGWAEKTYPISDADGFAAWQRDTGLETHSLVERIDFVDPETGDFRLRRDSAAVDRGQPLALTTAGGAGAELPVDSVVCFSAGFATGDGKRVTPGDEIMVAGKRARVVAIDRERSVLTLDRALRWRQSDPVNYVYAGAGPDVGALEHGIAVDVASGE